MFPYNAIDRLFKIHTRCLSFIKWKTQEGRWVGSLCSMYLWSMGAFPPALRCWASQDGWTSKAQQQHVQSQERTGGASFLFLWYFAFVHSLFVHNLLFWMLQWQAFQWREPAYTKRRVQNPRQNKIDTRQRGMTGVGDLGGCSRSRQMKQRKSKWTLTWG